jgi:hypothetical protein
MLRRVVASSLVALALSPFTAPFCTCDLSTLVAGHARHVTPPETFAFPTVITLDTSVIPADSSLAEIQLSEPPTAARARFFMTSEGALEVPSVHLGLLRPAPDNARPKLLLPTGRTLGIGLRI